MFPTLARLSRSRPVLSKANTHLNQEVQRIAKVVGIWGSFLGVFMSWPHVYRAYERRIKHNPKNHVV